MEIIIDRLPPKMTASKVVAIDTELFGMIKGKLHRPTGKFASMQFTYDGEQVYVITKPDMLEKVFEKILPARHVFHSANFDIRHIRRWYPYPDKSEMIDIKILEQILYSGYYDSFALKDLARRYLNVCIDKKEREEFVTAEEWTDAMFEYAALDAQLTWKIYEQQDTIATKTDYKVWFNIDQPTLYASLHFKPFHFNAEAWAKMAVDNSERAAALKETFNFNPNSPQQALQALHMAGLKKLTSTGENEICGYSEYPLVAKILEYRKASKSASTYGHTFLEKYLEDDYIYPEFNISGAETGRMSSSNPNIQNIPHDTEYRSCFIPSDGHVLIVADYSSQEPRITASETGDENLKTVIKTGDPHLNVGRRMFKDPTMKKSDPRRKKAKALNLGLTYGLTAKGLCKRLNDEATSEEERVTLEEAEKLVCLYFSEFPMVKRWIEEQREEVRKRGYTTTRYGRKIWINRFSYHWVNNAINAPIQGGGADVTKLAIAKLYKKLGSDFPMIAPIHDEIIIEVPEQEAEEKMEILKECMISAGQEIYPDVPFALEIDICKTWADKK